MRTRLTTEQGTAFCLRQAGPDDEAFLRGLYADRRASELAALEWTRAEQAQFIEMQFGAQQVGYATRYPDAEHWLIVVGERSVGRLLVDRRPDEHVVVDVVILTAYRNLGIGTALLREVVNDAGAAGLSVRLTVAADDYRLVRWYERLGFSVLRPLGPDIAMVRVP